MFKLIIVVFVLFSIHFLSIAQYEDYQVDSIVIHKQYKQKTVVGLSNEIAKDFDDRRCLIRAFYIYITYNMQYDVRAGNENKNRRYLVKTMDDIRKSDDKEMLKLLQTKKGVCWHFGNLFARLCAVQGIDVEVITGTRRGKVLPDTLAPSHLWNAVEIDGEMKMIDCTITYTLPYKKEEFDHLFLVDPEVFIYSSIPLDSDKQYLENPISYESFKRLVWPQPMFNLLQIKDLTPRFKRIMPNKDGLAKFKFKIDNLIQIDSLEVFINNRFVKSIPTNKPLISIDLPVTSLSWISIQAVKIKDGFKQNWYLLDYDVLK